MDEKSFPYRLDARTRGILAGIMQVLIAGGATLQSPGASPITILFDNKDRGVPMDAPVYATNKGIALVYRMNNVAQAHPQTMDWLKKYNSYISRRLKAPATPAAERCTVMVEATYEGQVNYYFTYMLRYEDDSLAQDTPQGLLVATEPLMLAASQQATRATPAQQAAGGQKIETASWI